MRRLSRYFCVISVLTYLCLTFVSCGNSGEPATVDACDGMKLYELPVDPSKKGPWPVGTRTITMGEMTVEVLYPAKIGSEEGKTKERYDLRDFLPKEEAKKIPDEDNPWQDCDCYRELPPDTERGPYPVVLFVHGTAGFRTQTLTQMTHWASRGFVVLAADHPQLMLSDVLKLDLNFNQIKYARRVLKDLYTKPASLSFLGTSYDITRIAVAGHSAGGNALSKMGKDKGVQVLIPMAYAGTDPATAPKSTLVLGGMQDEIAPYEEKQKKGYDASLKKKRLVGLTRGGHLAFSDLCYVGREKGGILKIALDRGVSLPDLFKDTIKKLASDGCKEGQLSAEKGWEITNFATSAVLEETLHCSASATQQIAKIKEVYPKEVGDFKEEL